MKIIKIKLFFLLLFWGVLISSSYTINFTPGGNIAAMPEISPTGGLYISHVNVSMSTSTPGGVIWYTLDGSDPTNAPPSIQYNGSIIISSTTTVKARTYAEGYTPSAIASVSYTIIVTVNNIGSLRAHTPGTGAYYQLTGEAFVTMIGTGSNYKAIYIQDARAAIMIYDLNPGVITTTYNIGDGITGIIGNLNNVNNMLCFQPIRDPGAPTSTGNIIAPQTIKFIDLSDYYQAQLIRIKNVTFYSTGTFTVNTDYDATDFYYASGIISAKYTNLDYLGQDIPTSPTSIIGVIYQDNTTIKFIPRSLADFDYHNYDYPEGVPILAQAIPVILETGNANIGTGNIPSWDNSSMMQTRGYIFDLIGEGPWKIKFITNDLWGAYYQNESWHPVQNVNGSIVMEITATKNLSVPVILGDQNPNLPVELTSFTADFTQSTTGDMYVSIKWTTQSETALAGYYLYRGTTNDLSAAEQITLLIVPANLSHGASYEFIDREIQSGTTYYYWLQSMEMNGSSDFHGPVSVTVNEGGNITPPAIITETRLLNAYPNPFNPTTTLCYTLKERGQAKIEIYNVRGQLIRSFMPAPQDKGYYQIIWDGKDLNGTQASSGVYYVRMACGKYVSSQRIVLMK